MRRPPIDAGLDDEAVTWHLLNDIAATIAGVSTISWSTVSSVTLRIFGVGDTRVSWSLAEPRQLVNILLPDEGSPHGHGFTREVDDHAEEEEDCLMGR